MDEQSEAILKLFGYLLIAPFWITWKVAQFAWRLTFAAVIEPRNHQRAAQFAGEIPEKAAARNEARAKQLQALAATAPAAPPAKLRATIQINETKQPDIQQKRISHFMGEDSFVHAEVGEITRYSVDMILQLPETDRAIIKQHELFDIVLEDVPFFSADELATMAANFREQDDDTSGGFSSDAYLHRAVRKEINKQTLDVAKKDRRKTRIGDLLVSPFSRAFDTPHEAKKFADKLKQELLPAMKKTIDSYRDFKPSETVEF